jgi:hypothetical protein
VAYRDFQEPRNHRLAGGVEPLGAATLLTPTDRAGDGPEPAVAASFAAFFVASSEAFFFVVASSAAFFFAASSTTFFFLLPLLRSSSLQPHPQPLSLQRPLLPLSCRLQPSCH